MRLLEATWDPSEELLFVWGENSQSSPKTIPETLHSGNAPDSNHPFACSTSQLVDVLELFEIEIERLCTLELYLPGSSDAPLPSPKLSLAEEIDRENRAELNVWRVPAVALSPFSALNFLSSLPHQLPNEVKFDDSIQFWREATKLLLELLTRGQFLPGMHRKNSAWHSLWHMLPTRDEDLKRLSVLAESMPPVCRAISRSRSSSSPEPSSILESFISDCSDGLIRIFMSRSNFLEGIDLSSIPSRLAVQIHWLRSLTEIESQIDGPHYDLMKFEQRLKNWAGELLSLKKSHHLQTAFRLLPPPPSSEDDTNPESLEWIVEFFLQSTTDSNQNLSAAQIWKGDPGFLQNSDHTLEDLEDQLLKDLGKALFSFPELERSLEDAHPTHVSLSITEAYSFLRDCAKRLEQQGFAVILPHWWNESRTKVGLHLNVQSENVDLTKHDCFNFLSSHQLLDYSWNIAVGDSHMSIEEFAKLVEKQTPLLRIDDRWVELQPSKLAATLKFIETQSSESPQIHFVDALKIGLGMNNEPDLLPVVGFSASGWIEQLLANDSHSLQMIDKPKGFKGELRAYQQEGLSWLTLLATADVGGCLADDMGLGKTIQFLALLLHERQVSKESNSPAPAPTLLIVPMSIIANWEYETERFSPELRLYIHHGPNRLNGKRFHDVVENSDLIVTTYSLAHRDEELLSSVPWRRIALDEAQNIKNLEAKQTQAVRRLAQARSEHVASPSARCQRVALTGTPLENHLEELWSIFDFLNPGFLGTSGDFRKRFVIPVERFRSKEAAEVLSRLIQPFVLRRLKTDPKIIDDLPEKIEMEVITSLTSEQAVLYQQVLEEMLPQVDEASGIHRKGLVLSTITRLKQICNHPTLFLKDQSALAERSGKLARLEEILDVILAEGDKVLLFTQYAQMGHLLKPYLQERFDSEVLFLHGALPRGKRDKLIQRFQKSDGPPLFILSLKAGGFGLNLTEANQVIHFDQWWNPAVEEQATDRAYRIGQKRSVQVRKFVCQGTLEEKINTMLKHKKDLAEQVVGSTKNVVTQLSTDELRNLLQLTAQ